MKRLVVVGGGISGTAAAFAARKSAEALRRPLEVRLLEREREIGGKARSHRESAWLFETGPIGYLTTEPIVDELVRDVGLEQKLLVASDAQKHRFVYSRGRVREVEAHPIGFATSGLLSLKGLLRAAGEPFIPAKVDDSDESVWHFAARRLGPELADRLVHPMVLGIFAGDAKRLSLEAVFPLMASLERDHGSLVRAQIARARMRRKGLLPSRRSSLCSFEEGIQSLPLALAASPGISVSTGVSVDALVRLPEGRYRLASRQMAEPLEADAVVLACEGFRNAEILRELEPEIARRLELISYPPVAVVALGYGSEARRRIPRGFGVLLPRGAGYRALGATWDGYLFDKRNAEEHLLLRVLFGGSFDTAIASRDTDELVETAKREMAVLLGLDAEPLFSRAMFWERAIPQYELGHLESTRRVEEALSGLPGLYLAGNALHGTAFGKAAATGVRCGRAAVEWLFATKRGEARTDGAF
ncbi:MAG TPA: protoporphyrinogen oxidase [Vicinamibacteria bacterium]|nr:protoporphyrinogen oxidase [Vicinamibacteria bacterium]